MKTKKIMKKRAASDHQKILDGNIEFYNQLADEHFPNQEKPETMFKKFSWNKLSVAVASIIMIVVTSTLLAVYLPVSNTDETKHYFEQNFQIRQLELSEIAENVQSFVLVTSGYKLAEVGLIFDSISKDKLFYKLTGADVDGLEEWAILIDVNKDFDIPYSKELFTNSKKFYSYTIKYHVTYEKENEMYLISTHAVIAFEQETVHIEYTCIAFEENANIFFDWMSKTIVKK